MRMSLALAAVWFGLGAAIAPPASNLPAVNPSAPSPPVAARVAPAPSTRQATPVADLRSYHVAACHPHDPAAFTQGLIYRRGELYESTGLVGRSTIRRVRIADGRILQSVAVDPPHFGEGMTDWKTDLISITWRSGKAFRWDRTSLTLRGVSSYSGEGWGLTQDGRSLVLSDGTANLRFLDPASFAVERVLPVSLNGRPLAALNELEWVDGAIFANVWQASQIVRIDPHTGKVTDVFDLTDLAAVAPRGDPDAVLNGIAYDAQGKRLFVTGKTWPLMFELRPGPRPKSAKGCPQLPDAKIVTHVVPTAP